MRVTTQLHKGENVSCWINDVLYVPKLATNLFSVFAATCKGILYAWILPYMKQEGKGDWLWLIFRQSLYARLCRSASNCECG